MEHVKLLYTSVMITAVCVGFRFDATVPIQQLYSAVVMQAREIAGRPVTGNSAATAIQQNKGQPRSSVGMLH
jgi:hypothetical protein